MRIKPRTTIPRLAVVYLCLAVIGLIGTWTFNILYFRIEAGGYVPDWFANNAAASAAIDLIVVATAASVFIIAESVRIGMGRWTWIFIVLSFVIAAAFAFPLFLAVREVILERRRAPEIYETRRDR